MLERNAVATAAFGVVNGGSTAPARGPITRQAYGDRTPFFVVKDALPQIVWDKGSGQELDESVLEHVVAPERIFRSAVPIAVGNQGDAFYLEENAPVPIAFFNSRGDRTRKVREYADAGTPMALGVSPHHETRYARFGEELVIGRCPKTRVDPAAPALAGQS